MENLNGLVVKYQNTEDKIILNKIIEILTPLIKKKAKFNFYKRRFKLFKKNIYLYKCGIVDLGDVEQEFWVEVLKLINNYDVKKGDFSSYLISNLWNWIPTFLTKDFVQGLSNVSLEEPTSINDENDTKLKEVLPDLNDFRLNLEIKDLLNIFPSGIERKILRILLKDKDINQKEIAKRLKKSEAYISQIIYKIRAEIKDFT